VSFFHRGRHRAGKFSRRVADIAAELRSEAEHESKRGRFRLTPDGKYLIADCIVRIPGGAGNATLTIAPSAGLVSIPVLGES
jgi:hypothetical protein